MGFTKPSTKPRAITGRALALGMVASMGGVMFGYASGMISGFFQMQDFADRFGEPAEDPTAMNTFSAVRQGTMTGLLPAGCLIGSLIAGKLADTVGRRYTISGSSLFTIIGTIIEISASRQWVQFAMGRWVTGLGIGALSVVVPMYQAESSPAKVRGMLIATYQLAITIGILVSYLINYGTHQMGDTSASWRITEGLAFLWALILGGGILLLPESPRFAYRHGREVEARATIARLAGVDQNSPEVNEEIAEIQEKLEQEQAVQVKSVLEIFTGPRMAYRTFLGMILQAGQQLTGANFFFYYGTTVFQATGLSDSYVTQIILGAVNMVCTFGGLWVVAKVGRRTSLIAGAAWMMGCFLIYSFVGHFLMSTGNEATTKMAGNILIVFSCLFIAAFATTWGPVVWTVTAEMYPAQYRAPCMAIATATNWFWNFMLSFFTRFIIDAISWLYGLVFAGCCGALIVIVFFFLVESKDRSLEEIETMYLSHVNPITSGSKSSKVEIEGGKTEAEVSS